MILFLTLLHWVGFFPEVPLDLSLTCVEHIPEKDITDGSVNDQGNILLLGDYTDPDFPLFYCTVSAPIDHGTTHEKREQTVRI